MNKQRNRKRLLSSLLCLSLVLSGLTVPAGKVQAEEVQTETTKMLGTGKITDPVKPELDTDDWNGSFVYFGTYNGKPVKYRVLDASTTDYSADGTTQTMLLDCDSILYYQQFDNDGKTNDWAGSDVKASLNGDGFLTKDGVFTSVEKNAIASSTKDSHELTTDSTTGVNVADWTQRVFVNYVALEGEQIFLLDAEDVSNGAYGYSMKDESCENRKKTGSSAAYWWLRSAGNDYVNYAGVVYSVGCIYNVDVLHNTPGVSPALNVNLTSVIFSSVIPGTAGEANAEYKLTLLDDAMTIAPESGVTKSGSTVTIPYTISGDNSGDATQVSVLVLDKEYTAGNTNGAEILDYQKLADIESSATSGTGTYTLPASLSGKKAGTDYHVYILAEDVNGEKETDYASKPVEIYLWEAPTVNEINFGTENIIDPARPNNTGDAWTGCYVWYGNYEGGPVKYRVLDASTTDYSEDETTQTMLLDCDSILYYQQFDNDGTANTGYEKANDWAGSVVKASLNGDGFLTKDGVFTSVEKNAIASSTKDSHELTTDSTTGVNVASWTQETFVNYVALGGEQIFLLDAEDVSNGAYGYSMTDGSCGNREKTGSSAAYWWLRSAFNFNDYNAGCVYSDGNINGKYVDDNIPGVSPAFNLNLTSVIFSSANGVSKSSALTSESSEIGTTTNTEWKLTLKDSRKTVALTEGRSVTKASDGSITVPYTYTDSATATAEKVNQISVMITDKAYDGTKDANAQEAQILYYGALGDISNAEDVKSTVAEFSTGTGTFKLPSGLAGTMGEDYHIYLLAEHVNTDNSETTVDESKNTDYASEPMEVTTILDEIDTVTIPSITAPAPEAAFATEVTIASTGVKKTAALTWEKVTGETTEEATGNAEWKTTYKAYVTLTADKGYALIHASGNIPTITYGDAIAGINVTVSTDNITLNEDGTLTACLGEFTSATRKTTEVTAPEVPAQFTSYYTADNVLTSTELGKTAKVTLEGTTLPNPVDMEVEWTLANADDAEYDATPAAKNTFKWTVKESEYAEYDVNNMVLTGMVTIQNKDYTPVTISGSDVTITYDGSDTLDVSKYFTIDENAGAATYELMDTSTGIGSLEGKNLTMTTLGTFVVKVSTAINEVYNKGEHTLTITVKKATPDVTELPTVADRTYHPTEALADTDLQGGTVKGVKDESLAGTWSWKESDVVATADNNGYVAVFTPEDTTHYETIEKTISVKVSKATPYIGEVPSAEAVTYGETLNDSVLSGGVVCYSKDDDAEVAGTWSFKEAETKPTVADSEKTSYDVVFTPADTANYNEAETQITLTVNKAKVATISNESKSYTYAESKTGESITVTGVPEDCGSVTYSLGTVVDDAKMLENVSVNTTGKITYDVKSLAAYKENVSATIPVTVEMQNYETATYSLTINRTDKQVQTISAEDISLTYGDDDATISVKGAKTALKYEVTEDYNENGDVITVDANGTVGIVNAGTATVKISTDGDEFYAAAECAIKVTVAKCTVKVPEEDEKTYTYTGNSQTYDIADSLFYTIKNATQTSAGTYKVSVELINDNYQWSGALPEYLFTINKAESAIVTAPTATAGLVYSGKETELIDTEKVSVTGGTMQYSLDGKDYTTAIPTGMDAGKYTVYYKVAGDSNHKDSEAGTVAVEIARRELTVTGATAKDRVYDGTNTVEITVVTLGGVVDGDEVSVELSNGVNGTLSSANAGKYTSVTLPELTLTGENADNYTLVQPTTAVATNVTINKMDAVITLDKDIYNVTYGDAAFTLNVKDNNPEADVIYSSSNEDVATVSNGTVTIKGAGEATITVSLAETTNYNTVETKVELTVNKAKNTPNMPESTRSVAYTDKTVGAVTLPEGWAWQDSDKTVELKVGVAVTATAVYTGEDAGNYENKSIEVSITRQACTHTGGTATCSHKAVCTVCGNEYGEPDKTNHAGETEVRDAKEATCTEAGYTGDTYCKDCGEKTATGTTIAAFGHNYTSEVTKEPTTTEEGVRTYTCTRCGDSYTEVIPKLPTENPKTEQPTTENPTTEDPKTEQPTTETPTTQQSSQIAAEETQILEQKTDKDIKGSSFRKLCLRMSKVKKNSITLKWNKVKGADGYIVYGNRCNSKGKIYKMEKLSDTKKLSYTHKKLKKGTYYKYIVRAYKLVDGVKTTVATSKTLHITTSGGKYGNYTSVKVPKTKVTIKKGRKYTIKAKVYKKLAYETSNKNIATVTSKGVVKAKKKGSCYIYVYAQNGVYKKIKVTVK